VYRHPQYNIDELSQSLSETITKIAKNDYSYYILGNININLLRHQMIAEYNSIYSFFLRKMLGTLFGFVGTQFL